MSRTDPFRFAGGERSLRDVDRDRVVGIGLAVIGACQVALAFGVGAPIGTVLAVGGGYLVWIGTNLTRGRDSTASGWRSNVVVPVLVAVAALWAVGRTASLLAFG
ncbi:hypothetical protein [Natronococcus occultus]|uniref:Uncharacterized protein n=1 Tax=Natronococcus occultus SP4 TaxID=694430 RepID=L0JTN2_9EURY|nr:hypothetical protein [Natronococcus occultus]AGB36332.1 hypothetical protein Natoc_0469 [Natronococcus occultus SP4]